MHSKNYVVGIDIGGTNTVLGIVDRDGKIVHTSAFDTADFCADAQEYIETLSQQILSLIQKAHLEGQIEGIGIGVPNGNFRTGTVENAANLPWKGVIPLRDMIAQRVGIPTAINNDANLATLGEMAYGAAQGLTDFIMITLGTGVGSGIVADGKLIYGADGLAGELGHMIVEREGRPCGCGRKGCLETYTSATGVARTARQMLSDRSDPSLLRGLDPQTLSSKDVCIAAQKGDALAVEVFEYTGKILGESLANFVTFSNPQAIILFGGLVSSGDLLMRPLRAAFEENLLSGYKGRVEVRASGLHANEAALLGAAAMGWKAAEIA